MFSSFLRLHGNGDDENDDDENEDCVWHSFAFARSVGFSCFRAARARTFEPFFLFFFFSLSCQAVVALVPELLLSFEL